MSKKFKSAGTAALAFSLTVGVVGLLAEQPAAASPSDSSNSHMIEASELVSTAGLDLAKPADVRRLEARIRAATRRVCDDEGPRKFSAHEQICRTAARKSAQQQVASLVDRSQRLAAAGQAVAIRTGSAVTLAGGE
jgi:UrcA family protein